MMDSCVEGNNLRPDPQRVVENHEAEDNMAGLSLTEITFIHGIDICQTGTPAGKIWDSTLRYLRTCPGLKTLDWSKKEDIVKILMLWQDEASHNKFQQSLGIGLAAGLFAKGVRQQYRPLTVAEYDSIEKDGNISEILPALSHDSQSSSTRLDPIPITFSEELPQPKSLLFSLPDLLSETPPVSFTPEERRGCMGRVDRAWDARIDWTKEIGPNTGWHLGWPTPSGGHRFMKDLTGPKISPYSFTRQWLGGRPRNYDAVVDLVQMSFKPGVLNILRNKEDSGEPQVPIMEEGIERDSESIRDQKPQLKVVPSKELSAWSAMRTKLLDLDGCIEIYYGICVEPANTLLLFISWQSATLRSQNFPSNLIIPEAIFTDLSPYLESPPSSTYIAGPFRRPEGQEEIIKFYIPVGPNSREVFEHYYHEFVLSLRPLNPVADGHHVGAAGGDINLGWSTETIGACGTEIDTFVGAIRWRSEEAAKGWYQDFYTGMMRSYERLGWRMEGLKYFMDGCESFMLGRTTIWTRRKQERVETRF